MNVVSLSDLSVIVVKTGSDGHTGNELKEMKAGKSLLFALNLFNYKTRS